MFILRDQIVDHYNPLHIQEPTGQANWAAEYCKVCSATLTGAASLQKSPDYTKISQATTWAWLDIKRLLPLLSCVLPGDVNSRRPFFMSFISFLAFGKTPGLHVQCTCTSKTILQCLKSTFDERHTKKTSKSTHT